MAAGKDHAVVLFKDRQDGELGRRGVGEKGVRVGGCGELRAGEDPYEESLVRSGMQVDFVPVLEFVLDVEAVKNVRGVWEFGDFGVVWKFVDFLQEILSWSGGGEVPDGIVLTSPRGAEAFVSALEDKGVRESFDACLGGMMGIFVVGERSGEIVKRCDLKWGVWVGEKGRGELLGNEIVKKGGAGKNVVHFCGSVRRKELKRVLEEGEVGLKEVVVYKSESRSEESVRRECLEIGIGGKVLGFFSPRGVGILENAMGKEVWEDVKGVVSIGETTASALPPHLAHAISSTPTPSSFLTALLSLPLHHHQHHHSSH